MAASLRPLALLLIAASSTALAQAPVVDAYGNPVQPYGVAGGGYAAQAQAYGGNSQAGYAAPGHAAQSQGYGVPNQGYAVPQPQVSAQGELFRQIQQLSNEVARLRGLVEEQQYQIQQLRQEGLDRYQDLDSRLQAAAQAPAPAAASSGSSGSAPAASGAAASADPEKEKLLYDASFDLVKARDFAKADQAFSAFLRKYPQSQYAGNAQYWLGEVKLAQKDLPAAAAAFAAVTSNYPQSSKVPDALYKQADVLRRQGRADQARQLLQQVISQYPQSSAAQLAQRELARQ